MPRILQRYALVSLMFTAAFSIRSLYVATNSLWLDELYGYQVTQRGFLTILRNSMFESHPPLFYLVQWIGSGFGTLHSEWAYRWTSVVLGAATVVVLYRTARLTTHHFAATLVSVMLMLMPVHIYFSQESRSYALLTLWSALGTFLTVRLEQAPDRRRSWWLLTLVSIVGVWTGYSYLMVCGIQALYLGVRQRASRNWLWYIGALVVGCLPLAPLAYNIFRIEQTKAASADLAQLSFVELARMLLVGDTSRYGTHWGHVWIPVVYGALILIALAGFMRQRPAGGMYHLAQVGAPMVVFFVVAIPILGMRVPLFEWKQFIILLPSLFAIVACGFDGLARRGMFGRIGACVLCGVVLVGSGEGVRRIWSTTKSPEGDAVLALRREMQPGDAIVSLHYSLNGALSFYLPNETPYTYPKEEAGTLRFTRSTSVLRAEMLPVEHTASLADVREHPRIWVLGTTSMPAQTVEAITANCQKRSEQEFWPFAVMLYDCGTAMR